MNSIYKAIAGCAVFGIAGFATAALAGSFDSANVSSSAQLSSFSAIYVAPVSTDLDLDVVAFDRSGRGDRDIRDSDVADKADDLYDEIVSAFASSYSMASGAGAGVLTIETTLTGLKSSRPTMADYNRNVSVSGRSVYAGGADVEFILSEDGRTLAELSDSYSTTLGDHRVRAGIWNDADRAFGVFASKLADYVGSN